MIKNFRRMVLAGTLTASTGLGIVASVVNAQSQSLRQDLNGLILRHPRNGMIFWVDEGRIRHIYGMNVFDNLFNRSAIDNDISVTSIAGGPPVTNKNRLVRCEEANHPLNYGIYFLDQGTKRHILSPEAMRQNNFNVSKVRNVDCQALDAIPDGPDIQ
ncbi:MAG: hypothetical protein N5P05_000862 [Chroococcopsis gigantea SAG 12.99]|jgi:uncharacterized membrane protein (UPF0127 family)|nr:hypothetical protein [Chlorogloea purpurea SAG 13.99]MDV2999256.1 hypothetical protein [Chroococcopsis gigantea SAG 12.99]